MNMVALIIIDQMKKKNYVSSKKKNEKTYVEYMKVLDIISQKWHGTLT